MTNDQYSMFNVQLRNIHTMKNTSAALWHRFYDTAARFRELAPWQWLYDSDLFGIQHPDTGEIGWCSIMGNAGEHFALAVYRGAKGLDGFYHMADAGELGPDNPELLNAAFNQNGLMVSFEDATLVPPEQKTHLKALGLKFRGAGQWIVAQSLDPGMHPWLPEAQELPFFIQCMEQAMDIALRAKDDPDLLDDDRWLVRVPHRATDGTIRWSDTYTEEEDIPVHVNIEPVKPSKTFVSKVGFLPETGADLAISNFFSPAPIQERQGKRPWHPMLLLGIDPGSGMIVAQDMCALSDLPDRLEPFLLGLFKTFGGRPRFLIVHNTPLAIHLEELARAADIEVVVASGNEAFFVGPAKMLFSMMG